MTKDAPALGDIRIVQQAKSYPFLVEQYVHDRWNLLCLCMSQQAADWVAYACMQATVKAGEGPMGLKGIERLAEELRKWRLV